MIRVANLKKSFNKREVGMVFQSYAIYLGESSEPHVLVEGQKIQAKAVPTSR
jgi:ABC-type Fe3+/spermidine/putrescine transport system ATPase subunit